ncbi:NAD(P)-dependent oxidoreductase [Taibaiella sp. KBW10]|uniref:SDR family NAD(P)-dependent oxidoreductase n=1 Tax=Taibaiella sp. KBW10 TaxID=2153357 RepID=UPI000F59F7C5|nr:SDR family NAD(P)-dependent oxidoreductase [Taibaiella sp. KBW10]RQO29911.1 NAD(P)-dependent oxidoreductase [Taibaiella sp. KBW10]
MNILITGATSGIGHAIAQEFARNGHKLWITGRRADRLQEIKETLTAQYGATVYTSCVDVRNREETAALVDQIQAEWQAPDILINNAGLALGLSTIDKGDIDEWETMIDTNIKGLLYMTRHIAPLMVALKKGHIINIGSTAGKSVYPNGNVYCATKHAVVALSEGMRVDLMNYNIKVTALNPGMVDTEFSLVRYSGDEQKAAQTYLGFEPLHASDVAKTAYYCATLPDHVCINDITMTCTRQANGIFKTTDEAVRLS